MTEEDIVSGVSALMKKVPAGEAAKSKRRQPAKPKPGRRKVSRKKKT
jgi:hypothetical protein